MPTHPRAIKEESKVPNLDWVDHQAFSPTCVSPSPAGPVQTSQWGRESWLLCFFVFLVSRDCCVALPYDATGLSAVCECSIS